MDFEIIKAFIFGITIAIAVGPIAILIINSGIRYGLPYAVSCGLGAAFADFSYAFIAFTIGAVLLTYLAQFEELLSLISSCLLILIGVWLSFKAIKARKSNLNDNNTVPKKSSGFLKLYLLTMSNPLTIVIFIAFSGQISAGTPLDVLLLAIAVGLGSFVIQALLAFFGATLKKIIQNQQFLILLNLLSGLIIATFGFFGLLQG